MRMRRTAVAVTTVATALTLSVAGGTAAYAQTGSTKDRKPCPADSAKPKPSDSAKPKPTESAKPRPTVTVTATVNPTASVTATVSPSATATRSPGLKLLTPFLTTGTLEDVNVKAGTLTVDVADGPDVTVKVPPIAQVLLNGKSVLPSALTDDVKVSVTGLRSDTDYYAGLVQAGVTPVNVKAGVNLDVLRAAINLGNGGLQAGINLGGTKPKPTTTPTPAPTVTVTQTASPGPTVTVTVTTTTTTTASPKPTTSVEPGNPAPTTSVEPGNP